jgi:hypothetical protein
MALVGGDSEKAGDKWIADSGASEHMTSDRSIFIKFETLSTPIKILVGGGTPLDATGRGQVTVEAFDGNEYYVVPMNDVLHVPDLCLNLFSVGTALDKGYKVQGETDRMVFLKDDEVCPIANRQGTKFFMDFKPVQQEACAALSMQD